MHFNVSKIRKVEFGDKFLNDEQVEGPLNKGVVRIHLTKPHGQSGFQYQYLALDVAGTR